MQFDRSSSQIGALKKLGDDWIRNRNLNRRPSKKYFIEMCLANRIDFPFLEATDTGALSRGAVIMPADMIRSPLILPVLAVKAPLAGETALASPCYIPAQWPDEETEAAVVIETLDILHRQQQRVGEWMVRTAAARATQR